MLSKRLVDFDVMMKIRCVFGNVIRMRDSLASISHNDRKRMLFKNLASISLLCIFIPDLFGLIEKACCPCSIGEKDKTYAELS